MMPLNEAREEDTVIIQRISGTMDERLHLAKLGIVVDAKVKILHYMEGNLIIRIRDNRIALDKSMAQKIFF